MRFSVKQSRPAFTLIELLVTTAVIGILSAVIFSNFAQEQDRGTLKNASRLLQSDLQNMQINGQAGVLRLGSPANGYGINIQANTTCTPSSPCTYTLFADNIPSSPGVPDSVYTGADNPVVLTRSLPANIQIVSVTGSPLNILYKSPNGTAVFNAGALTSAVEIKLKSTKLGKCYAVTVAPVVGTAVEDRTTTCP